MKKINLLIFAVSLLLTPSLTAQTTISQLKTFGTAGKEETPLSPDREAELFSHHGKGCLTHMWFGGDFNEKSARTRIRVYVDDEVTASIDMELFMGTGIGFGDMSAPWGSEKMGKTGGGNNVYNTFRIPFGRSVRVTGQLAPGGDPRQEFWWIIRGTENLPVQIGGVTLPETARLKLYKVEKYPAKPLEQVVMCNVPGAGTVYLTTIAVKGDKPNDLNFMEGCVRAYFGGTDTPTLISSGFEDYFLGTYYFNRGKYANGLAGLTHLDNRAQEVSAYRFHDDDPIFFQDGLKLTIRCGETEHGGLDASPGVALAGNPPPATYTTYTWLYQW